jgi:hypothetical protein
MQTLSFSKFLFLLLIISVFMFSACKPQEVINPINESIKAHIRLNADSCRSFIQRDNANEGEVYIYGQADKAFTDAKVKFINALGGSESVWFTLQSTSTGIFKGKFKLQGGGYYPVLQLSKDKVLITDSTIQKSFNVGEVFALIGHSMAEGQQPYFLDDFDQKWCDIVKWDFPGSNNAFWGRLADKLKGRLKVPIRIYNTANGGSTSEYYGKSAYGLEFQSTIYNWRKNEPFSFFEGRLKNDFVKSGLRAVLVMHGENDLPLPEDKIVDYTRMYITRTRELLQNPSLTFVISKCNPGGTSPNELKVRAAQKRMLNEIDYTYLGANLEKITGAGYRWDGTHFNFAGLEEAANQWDIALNGDFFAKAKPYLPAR